MSSDQYDEDPDVTAAWEWDPDEIDTTATTPNPDADDGSFLAVNPEAFDNYVPIIPADPAAGLDDQPKIYYLPPQRGTEAERYDQIPTNARNRFWAYRHELYEQFEYILVRFAELEIGRTWLIEKGWGFPTMVFRNNMVVPITNMDERMLTRRQATQRREALDRCDMNELNAIIAWKEDLRRCVLRVLGSDPAHVARMATLVLLEASPSTDVRLCTNALEKTILLLADETRRDRKYDWAHDARKTYTL